MLSILLYGVCEKLYFEEKLLLLAYGRNISYLPNVHVDKFFFLSLHNFFNNILWSTVLKAIGTEPTKLFLCSCSRMFSQTAE